MKGASDPSALDRLSMDDSRQLPEAFVNDLHQAWVKRHEELTGVPSIQGEIEDMEAFWHAQYRRYCSALMSGIMPELEFHTQVLGDKTNNFLQLFQPFRKEYQNPL